MLLILHTYLNNCQKYIVLTYTSNLPILLQDVATKCKRLMTSGIHVSIQPYADPENSQSSHLLQKISQLMDAIPVKHLCKGSSDVINHW